MIKNEFIEKRVKEFEYKFYGANDPKVLDVRDYLRQSLEEAWHKGAMQGYKEGIHSKENIKKLIQSTNPFMGR